MRQRHSKIDQENLITLLDKWRHENQQDLFHFRPCTATPPTTPPDSQNDDGPDSADADKDDSLIDDE